MYGSQRKFSFLSSEYIANVRNPYHVSNCPNYNQLIIPLTYLRKSKSIFKYLESNGNFEVISYELPCTSKQQAIKCNEKNIKQYMSYFFLCDVKVILIISNIIFFDKLMF